MRCEKIFLCVVLILFAATLGGCKIIGKMFVRGTTKVAIKSVTDNSKPTDNRTSERSHEKTPTKPTLQTGAIVTGSAVVADKILSEDPHWLKDSVCGAYVWNFRSQEFDEVRFNGDVLREDRQQQLHPPDIRHGTRNLRKFACP